MFSGFCGLSVVFLSVAVAMPALADVPTLLSQNGSVSIEGTVPQASKTKSRHQLESVLEYLQYGELATQNPNWELETATVSFEYKHTVLSKSYRGLAIFPVQPLKAPRLIGDFYQVSGKAKEGCTGSVVVEQISPATLRMALIVKGALPGLRCSLPTSTAIENTFSR